MKFRGFVLGSVIQLLERSYIIHTSLKSSMTVNNSEMIRFSNL